MAIQIRSSPSTVSKTVSSSWRTSDMAMVYCQSVNLDVVVSEALSDRSSELGSVITETLCLSPKQANESTSLATSSHHVLMVVLQAGDGFLIVLVFYLWKLSETALGVNLSFTRPESREMGRTKSRTVTVVKAKDAPGSRYRAVPPHG